MKSKSSVQAVAVTAPMEPRRGPTCGFHADREAVVIDVATNEPLCGPCLDSLHCKVCGAFNQVGRDAVNLNGELYVECASCHTLTVLPE